MDGPISGRKSQGNERCHRRFEGDDQREVVPPAPHGDLTEQISIEAGRVGVSKHEAGNPRLRKQMMVVCPEIQTKKERRMPLSLPLAPSSAVDSERVIEGQRLMAFGDVKQLIEIKSQSGIGGGRIA